MLPPLMNTNPFNWQQAYRVNCGELRKYDIGKTVELSGKVHKISRDRFVQLKDYHGLTQLVLPMERGDLQRRFAKMPLQSFVGVVGVVRGRPGRGHNEKLQTGEIEVEVQDIVMVKIQKTERKSVVPSLPLEGDPPSATNPPKITSEEYHKFLSTGLLKKLNERKYTCADLPYFMNKTVTLMCWVEKPTKKFIFVIDGYGKIQCVVPNNNEELGAIAEGLKQHDIVCVTGKITARPQAQINHASLNGNIELQIENLEVPTPLDDGFEDIEMLSDAESSILNEFCNRTHTCGELRAKHVGQRVVLYGWLHYQRLSKFLNLRDSYGIVQCILPEQGKPIDIAKVPLESIVKVDGMIMMRPPMTGNENMITGDVEVLVEGIEILNTANNLPVAISNAESLRCEQMRLTYRYVDLRSPRMQSNLRLRSLMLHNIRKFLIDKYQFVEVETPLLCGKSIDNSVDFLVNTDDPAVYYSLTQSSQMFNQMLMAGGMDRCFQISKCFRNVPVTVESQPEFTQLSIEVSFADADKIINLIEQMLSHAYPTGLKDPPYERITYANAIRTYGSTTPDCSFDLKFLDVTTFFKQNLDENGGAFALLYPKEIVELSDSVKESINKIATKYKTVTLVKNTEASADDANVKDFVTSTAGYPWVVAYGNVEQSCFALGEIRLVIYTEMLEKKLIKPGGLKPVWITDHPAFVKDENGQRKFGHQPFPSIHPDDMKLLKSSPLRVRAQSFDLIINGQKCGGGAVRATDDQVYSKQLKFLNLQESFTHLTKMISSGCPPHAGILLGIDRLLTLACDASTTRDVIAFPKAKGGKDLVTGAPFHVPNILVEEEDTDGEPRAKIKRLE